MSVSVDAACAALSIVTTAVVIFAFNLPHPNCALVPLAAFALSGDALGAGEARFYCILIGVTIGTTFVLVLSSQRVSNASKRLGKKIRRSEAPAA